MGHVRQIVKADGNGDQHPTPVDVEQVQRDRDAIAASGLEGIPLLRLVWPIEQDGQVRVS